MWTDTANLISQILGCTNNLRNIFRMTNGLTMTKMMYNFNLIALIKQMKLNLHNLEFRVENQMQLLTREPIEDCSLSPWKR